MLSQILQPEQEDVMALDRVEKLRVYRSGFEASMRIFELSKSWPKEERYALTDQIRRSSRAVCANLAEAWRKRRYPRHFVSKLTDADGEAEETRTWLRFAFHCGYIEEDVYRELDRTYDRISGGLVKMINQADRWCVPSNTVGEDGIDYDLDQ